MYFKFRKFQPNLIWMESPSLHLTHCGWSLTWSAGTRVEPITITGLSNCLILAWNHGYPPDLTLNAFPDHVCSLPPDPLIGCKEITWKAKDLRHRIGTKGPRALEGKFNPEGRIVCSQGKIRSATQSISHWLGSVWIFHSGNQLSGSPEQASHSPGPVYRQLQYEGRSSWRSRWRITVTFSLITLRLQQPAAAIK